MKYRHYLSLTAALICYNALLSAQTEEPIGAAPEQSFWQTLVMIGIVFVFFYIILWRPEQKKRKALDEQRNSLKKGDCVAAMGILGTVVKVGDQTVILRMYDGAKIEFYKAAITEILPEETNKDNKDKKVETIE